MKLRRLPLILIVLFLAVLAGTATALAHAELIRSDPEEGARLASAPPRVTLWFSENLEPGFSTVKVAAPDNTTVSTGNSSVSDADHTSMSVALGDLKPGVYTVIWQALSADDGHTSRGAYAFAIGDTQTSNGSLALASAAFGQTTAPPNPLAIISRWLTFLAATSLLGAVAFQVLITGPIFAGSADLAGAGERVRGRYHRLLIGAAIAVLLVLPMTMIAQAMTAGNLDAVSALAPSAWLPLFGTRFGQALVVRAMFGALALLAVIWLVLDERKSGSAPLASALVVGLTAASLAAVSVTSHASGAGTWAWLAIVADWLHLLAMSAWMGGLFLFALAIGPFLASVPVGKRVPVLGRMIPRFSRLALISVTVLVLTGLYAMWLHIPSLESLAVTDYGRALDVKLVLFAIVMALAALNLLIVSPALRGGEGAAVRLAVQVRNFVRQVRAEAIFGVAILLTTAVLIMQVPASTAIGGAYSDTETGGDLKATLRVTPNDVGVNQYYLIITRPDGSAPPAIDSTTLQFQMLDHEMGRQELALTPGGQNAWSGSGAQLSMVGNWGIRALVKQPGADDVEFRYSLRVGGAAMPQDRGPLPTPASVGLSNLALIPLGMIVLGFLVAVQTLRMGTRRVPRWVFTGALAVVLLGLFVMIFKTPRLETVVIPGNPIPKTQESIADGQVLYQQNCAACHGAAGKGDGPLARGLSPRPADLSQHVAYHPEGQLFLWVANGVPGTAMQAWGSQFTPEEIWDIVNYLVTAFNAPAE